MRHYSLAIPERLQPKEMMQYRTTADLSGVVQQLKESMKNGTCNTSLRPWALNTNWPTMVIRQPDVTSICVRGALLSTDHQLLRRIPAGKRQILFRE
jgi:hypothetical protein